MDEAVGGMIFLLAVLFSAAELAAIIIALIRVSQNRKMIDSMKMEIEKLKVKVGL